MCEYVCGCVCVCVNSRAVCVKTQTTGSLVGTKRPLKNTTNILLFSFDNVINQYIIYNIVYHFGIKFIRSYIRIELHIFYWSFIHIY